MRYFATTTSNGRVTIPAAMRKRYGLTPGTEITWVDENGEVFITWHGSEGPARVRVTFDNSTAKSTPKKKTRAKRTAKP